MKDIKYTDTAQERLDRLYLEFKDQIEDYIRSTKYNLGDDFIEVTASDIEEIRRRIRIIRPYKSTYSRSMIMYLSIVFGVILMIFGIYYDSIMAIFKEGNPVRLFATLYGLLMIIFGVFYLFIFKQRKNKENAYFEKMERDRIIKRFDEFKE